MEDKKIIYRQLANLKKLANNPRTITKKDMNRLKKSVAENRDYFEARPIILSDRTGELVIIAGNQRYEAAKALKIDKVPTFLLSGSTLIAAEQTSRICYGCEIDPKYCDVIRKRYWKLITGSEDGWQEGTK